MLRNEVCECRASGVFLRLSAQGLIAENNIHSNGEAGLDIRKGANPIVVVIVSVSLCLMLIKKKNAYLTKYSFSKHNKNMLCNVYMESVYRSLCI